MSKYIFYPAGTTPVLLSVGEFLKRRGYGVVDHPCESVTHCILSVPSFDDAGNYKGNTDPDAVLASLPKNVAIVGGNIPPERFPGYRIIDLLRDPRYLADNAAITAYCALRLAMMELPVMLRGIQVLIIGWGRISKCLAALLWGMEADVTIAARKEEDRAIAHALGYHAEIPEELGHNLNNYRLILNTAPAPVLSEDQVAHCRENCLKIDLASKKGIAGSHVIWARGLPGKDTPESSGKLIAKTIIRLLDRKENQS